MYVIGYVESLKLSWLAMLIVSGSPVYRIIIREDIEN